jgi:hypothetical protein
LISVKGFTPLEVFSKLSDRCQYPHHKEPSFIQDISSGSMSEPSSMRAAAQSPRFQIVGCLGRLKGSAQQSTVPLRPFAPVVPIKSVAFNFRISLENAAFTRTIPCSQMHPSSIAKPSFVIARWAYAKMDAKSMLPVVSTASTMFMCNEAAVVTGAWSSETGVCDLRTEWVVTEPVGSTAVAEFKKELRLNAIGNGFEDQFVQITCLAAKQKQRGLPPSAVILHGHRSQPLVLGGPFLINLSVKSRLSLCKPCSHNSVNLGDG